jgi:ATP adenylyltransferase
VSLEHLWAGWRSAYVASFGDGQAGAAPGAPGAAGAVGAAEPELAGPARQAGAPEQAGAAADGGRAECVFCRIAASRDDETDFVLWRGENVLAVLNAYPYASGHLMVMPARHVGELEQLPPATASELWQTVERAVLAVKGAYSPDGLNIGLNLGRAAGAGIPAHLHVHVVPRWIGDTNFMTAVASARVLPEAITESWAKLRAAWPR